MQKEVRIGIVGIGNMGSAHAVSIFEKKIDGMQLVAVCDIRPERLVWARERFGGSVSCYENYGELFASGEIDAVLIATPHKLHPVLAVEAFAAGLHVLTEKPAGIDTASVRTMNEAAEAGGKIFGIMYNQRTNPLYQELRRLVQTGQLGEIKRSVWIINNWYRTQAYYDSGSWRATWNGEGGGVLLNQCPHNLDLWQWIVGMPVRLRAFCRIGQYHEIAVEDDVTIYTEYANGANGIFITSTGEYPGTNRLEISGTRGKAVLEKGELTLSLLDCDERELCRTEKAGMPKEPVTTTVIRQEAPETGHLGILRDFAKAVIEGTQLLAPGQEGIKGLAISNAAYLSEWTQDWVSLPVDEAAFARELAKRQKEESLQEDCKQENSHVGEASRQQVGSKKSVTDEASYGVYKDRWSIRW